MILNDKFRFLFQTLAVFCLTLGATVMFFSLVERIFFAERFVGIFVKASSIAVILGGLFLLIGRRKIEAAKN